MEKNSARYSEFWFSENIQKELQSFPIGVSYWWWRIILLAMYIIENMVCITPKPLLKLTKIKNICIELHFWTWKPSDIRNHWPIPYTRTWIKSVMTINRLVKLSGSFLSLYILFIILFLVYYRAQVFSGIMIFYKSLPVLYLSTLFILYHVLFYFVEKINWIVLYCIVSCCWLLLLVS